MNLRDIMVENFKIIFSSSPSGLELLLLGIFSFLIILLTIKKYKKSYKTAIFLTGMRLLIIISLIFVLMKPEFIANMKYKSKEKLLILVDGSSSMSLPFESKKLDSRYDVVKKYIDKYITPSFYKRFKIKKIEFSTFFKKYNSKNIIGEGLTDIGKSCFYDDKGKFIPDDILIFTDGVVTSGQSLEFLSNKIPSPLFLVPIGKKISLKDIYIDSINYDGDVYKDEVMAIKVYIRRKNVKENKILVKIENENKKVIDSEIATFNDGSDETLITLKFTPTNVGENVYDITLQKLKNEDITVNNSKKIVVNVKKKGIKVLLITSYPEFDFLFLKRFLESKRGIDLSCIFSLNHKLIDIKSDSEYNLERLKDNNLFILQNIEPSRFNDSIFKQIGNIVKSGKGNILFIGGNKFKNSILKDMIPMSQESGYLNEEVQMELTNQGSVDRVTQLSKSPQLNKFIFADMPKFSGIIVFKKVKSSAIVLIKSSDKGIPILTMGRYGSGKVLFLSVLGIYKLLFRPELLVKNKLYFEKLLKNCVSYLASDKENELTLEFSKLISEVNEPVDYFIESPNVGTVTIECSDKNGRVVFKKQWKGNSKAIHDSFIPNGVGKFNFILKQGRKLIQKRIYVEYPQKEFIKVNEDNKILKRFAESNHGLLITKDKLSGLLNLIPNKSKFISKKIKITLYDNYLLFFLILLLLTIEWGVRKLWKLE